MARASGMSIHGHRERSRIAVDLQIAAQPEPSRPWTDDSIHRAESARSGTLHRLEVGHMMVNLPPPGHHPC